MWTEITRPKYGRKGAGYSSDLSDAEWAMRAQEQARAILSD